MVSPALQQEFERRGVVLIPIDEGCRLFEQELRHGRKGEAEVVIGGATGLAAPTTARRPAGSRTSTEAAAAHGRDALSSTRRRRSRSCAASTSTRDLYLERPPHRRPRRSSRSPARWSCMAEAAVAAQSGARARGAARRSGVLKGVDGRRGRLRRARRRPLPARPRRRPRRSRRTITAVESGRPHYRAVVDLRHPGAAPTSPAAPPTRRPAALPDDASRTPTATSCSTGRCSSGSTRSTGWTSAAPAPSLLPSDPAAASAAADGRAGCSTRCWSTARCRCR